MLEGVRLGLSQKKTPRDSTQTYSPRGLTFSDGPRMTPYLIKLKDGLANNSLLTIWTYRHHSNLDACKLLELSDICLSICWKLVV